MDRNPDMTATNVAPKKANKNEVKVPEKFLDPESGELRVDQLISSYVELEKKLSSMMPKPDNPEGKERLKNALGVPSSPQEYNVKIDNGLLEPDEEVNKRMHDMMFTPEQVQLVYDMAGEFLVPMVSRIASEYEADREVEKLVAEFGGEEKFQEVSRQLIAFGNKNLPQHVFENLANSYDGVMALYKMMKNQDPRISPEAKSPESADENDLQAMIRDPKYWRDKDAAFIEKVSKGFERLYASNKK